MRKKKVLKFLFPIVSFLLMTAINTGFCQDKTAKMNVTDYSFPGHWLSMPAHPSKSVDVFYVYPTAYHKVDPSEPDYAPIDNPIMLKGAAVAFSNQATAFETVGNVYAPYYRQATLPDHPMNEKDILQTVAGSPAFSDIAAAFDYYINHYNNGKPFILAGHSQGSLMLMPLLSKYMAAHPDVYARMIAAYVIGVPVTARYMSKNSHLKFAVGPDDTGVIISYNTQSPDVPEGGNFIMGKSIGLVINPVNWKRDATLASTSESLGSFMPGADNIYVKIPAYADARIDPAKGVLVCSSADEDVLSGKFGHGVYHMWDYPLYYYNLRENAERRARKFLGK